MFANKKAISELISYVLLITLAIAMAATVWFFIKPWGENPLPEEECPGTVNIVLENYSCEEPPYMEFYLSNRGLHNITGIRLKIINNTQGLEYDWWLFLPISCGEITNCEPCLDGDCLGVGTVLYGKLNYYSNFDNIQKLAIYPMRTDAKGFYQLCSGAVVRIPISNCFGGQSR